MEPEVLPQADSTGSTDRQGLPERTATRSIPVVRVVVLVVDDPLQVLLVSLQ